MTIKRLWDDTSGADVYEIRDGAGRLVHVEHDTPVSVTYPRGRPFAPELSRLDEHLAARV